MAIDRAACVKKYLALQDEARRLVPKTRTPHITSDMSDAEIVRHGQWLAKIVEQAKQAQGERQEQEA